MLAVLATGRRVAEAGTAFGEAAEAMAGTAATVVTVEKEPRRAAIAAARLEPLANVELLVGDWRELLPRRGPFELLFHDAGDLKRAPGEYGGLVLDLLEPGGLLVLDDLTPGRDAFDPIRAWAFGHPALSATEVLTTPGTSALLIARRG